MGIRIHYGDKEQFYDFTPIPYENGASVAGVPIKVSELPEPTEEIVGKIYYNTTNGVHYIGEQYPEATIGDRIYFDTTKNPAEFMTEPGVEIPLFVMDEMAMLMAMAMPIGDEGQDICYLIIGVFDETPVAVYIYCDTITVEQFNTYVGASLGLSITEFGWQTDSIGLGYYANYTEDKILENNLAEYNEIGYIKVNNIGFKPVMNKHEMFISGSLTEIVTNVSTVRDYAFANCKSTKSITFSSPTINSLGWNTFFGCDSLETVTIRTTTPPPLVMMNGRTIFYDPSTLTAIYVPSESVEAYKSAYGWNEHVDIIKPIPQE